MFKKFSPPFFSENRVDKKEQDSSVSQTSWRKTISPVPSFLLKGEEKTIKEKKESVLKADTVVVSSSQNSKKTPFEKTTEPRGFFLSGQEKKIFGKASLYNSQSAQEKERYVFTMTKFSFWTVLGSLLILGILFFLGGFGLALYLVTSSPSLIAKIDHQLSWKGKPLDSSKSNLVKEEGKLLPVPASSSAAPGQVPSPTSSPHPSPVTASSQSPSSSASAPAAVDSLEKSVHKERKVPPSSLKLPVAVFSLKMSPLLVQKDSSQGVDQKLSPYSLEYGVFITREEALKRADSLIQKGYRPIIIRGKDTLHIFSFSVRCGNYPTRDIAVKDLQNADKEFGPIVVRNSSESKVVYP